MDNSPQFKPALEGWREHQNVGFMKLAGPVWSKDQDGERAYALLTDERHANAAKIVHGGVLTTLMDNALSAIAWKATDRRICVTAQLDFQFLTSVPVGAFVIATGRVIRMTSTLVFMRGSLSVLDEEVAAASAIFKILKQASV